MAFLLGGCCSLNGSSSSTKLCLRPKIRFVCGPSFLLGSPALLAFLLLTCNFALGSFLLVQSDRLDNSCLSKSIHAFRNNKHSKPGLVRGTEEV